MKKLLIFTTILLFVGCRAVQLPPERHETTETVRIEFREILRDTTIYIKIPVESHSVVLRDTISELETSLARSVAMWSDGLLHHSLENRDTTLQARIVYRDREMIRDSIRSEYREIPYPVPAEFTRWQSCLIVLGQVFFWLITLGFIYSLFIFYRTIKRGLKGN
jgi:hypothetical protein